MVLDKKGPERLWGLGGEKGVCAVEPAPSVCQESVWCCLVWLCTRCESSGLLLFPPKMQLVNIFPIGRQYKYSHPRRSQSFVHFEGWLAERPEEGSNVPHWHCPSHPKDRTMAIKQIQAPSLSFICLVYKLAPRQKLLQWEWEGLIVLLQLRYFWELSQCGVKRRAGHSRSNGVWGQGPREAGDGQSLTGQVKPNLI